MKESTKEIQDIEVLNVNKELITNEKHNGFAIKKNKALMVLKKIPGNIYSLTVLLLAAIGDAIPDFISRVPLVGLGVDALRALGTQYFTQVTSDTAFDELICPLFNIPVDNVNFENPIYNKAFAEFTHHNGKYFKISLLIKTVSQFAMEHPALIIAGGAALAGFAYKVGSLIIKKMVRSMKYNDMNEKQKETYQLLKEVIKKARKIKKIGNGDILVKDLNITYEIIEHLRDYPDMLDKIEGILTRLKVAIENKDEAEYENCRLDLETSVFTFDNQNDNLLNREMRLIEAEPKVATGKK